MPSMNEVKLAGHLGADPEIRYSQSGKAVCKFRLGVSSKAGSDRDGNGKDDTYWAHCVTFGKTAELIAGATKGQPVFVSGKLATNEWTDKDSGQKRSATQIIAWSAWVIARMEPVVREQQAEGDNEPF
jgi:single-strand DNA-binding protein